MIKFLVVDDEIGVSDDLRDFLKKRGYNAISTTSGIEALQLIKREKPNIIVLDILMEGMTGIEVLREIKKTYPKIRVIMLTALEDEATQDQCKKLGASAYIIKPYSYEEILKAAHKLINDIYEEETRK